MKSKCYEYFRNFRIIGGFQDTRNNNEDFAITPYLFSFLVNMEVVKVVGIGICWGYYSVYMGIGKNIPNGYSGFRVRIYKKK